MRGSERGSERDSVPGVLVGNGERRSGGVGRVNVWLRVGGLFTRPAQRGRACRTGFRLLLSDRGTIVQEHFLFGAQHLLSTDFHSLYAHHLIAEIERLITDAGFKVARRRQDYSLLQEIVAA